MDELTIFIYAACVLLGVWITKRWKRMSILKSLGVPGPKPNFFFGNIRDINKKGIDVALCDWYNEYGTTFGYYMGANPIVVILDTDVLKQIQIKDFHSFMNRPKLVKGGSIGVSSYTKHVIAEENDRWKQQRAILTPTFTSGKMKQMMPHLNKALEIFLGKVEEKSIDREEFDIYDMFKGLTLDVISRTAFGTETNVQLNPRDPFLEGVKDFLRDNPFSGVFFIMVCFPEIMPLVAKLRSLYERVKQMSQENKMRQVISGCVNIVKGRRSNPKFRRDDLLQLMLDAEISREKINETSTEHLTVDYDSEAASTTEVLNGLNTKTKNLKSRYTMSDSEVVSNTVLFIIAGYETTSTALGYMTHALVSNPEIQEKIREEIRMIEKEDGELQYSSITKMKYLDQVLSETLRFYTPVPVVGRAVSKTETYGNLVIPPTVTVQVPVKVLHRDAQHWKNPDVFDPERFAPENKKNLVQMAYQPFGAGPRNCIGMRFAQMEAKLAMASLLSRYRLVPSENSEVGKLTCVSKIAVVTPKRGVFVKVEKL